jgi:putative phage-type endonuclease
MEQRSPEWFAARLGKVTASRVADVIAKTKTGPAASRANYLSELVLERLTGEPLPSFTNAAMQWGTDKEPEARDAYGFMHDAVTECAFINHPTIAMSGASPDGLVGDVGLVEIKCPSSATHLDTLRGAPIPAKYVAQMQWQMACTGRAWCDFASYDPRFPPAMQLHVQRVARDDAFIAEVEREVAAFLDEVAEAVESLNATYAERLAA